MTHAPEDIRAGEPNQVAGGGGAGAVPGEEEDFDRLIGIDQRNVVHSWSTQLDYSPRVVVGGEGVWYWDHSGRRLLDFTSQAFFANVGHGNRRIVEAIATQAERVTFAYGHASIPKLQLVERLLALLPPSYKRVWFGLNGTDAVELALKAARLVTGRQDIVTFHGEYHGSAMGATSLTGIAELRRGIGALVPGSVFLPGPQATNPSAPDAAQEESDRRALELLRHAVVGAGQDSIAAIFGEPMLTGGMPAPVTIPGPGYWRAVRELCDQTGALLITDEVVTGFGRVGHWFGRDHYDFEPDILCLGKGITSGYLPLSAVVFRDTVADALEGKFLPHGLTHTGHPICCAAAIANIDVIEQDDLVSNAAQRGAELRRGLDRLKTAHARVRSVRSLGLFAGLELASDGSDAGIGAAVADRMEERGVIVRGAGNVVKVGPPLIVTSDQIDLALEALDDVLTHVEDRL